MEGKHTVPKKYLNLPQTNISKCIRHTTLCSSIERLAADYKLYFERNERIFETVGYEGKSKAGTIV
jgi:hypothetical protein